MISHKSTIAQPLMTPEKQKSTASSPAFCQVRGGALLKSVRNSAISSDFRQKIRTITSIPIVSKYASLHAASAGIYTLVETAKANGLDAIKYIKYILSDMPGSRFLENPEYLDDYLPWDPMVQERCR